MSRVAKAFGRKLRELRLARQLSQEQVAERSGLSANAIGSFERGVRFPRDTSLDALLDALGVEPDALALAAVTARDGPGAYLSSLPVSRPLRDVVELLADQPDEVVLLVRDIARLVVEDRTGARRER
jgi:transcriptional regulator with XRE-family HTH domain